MNKLLTIILMIWTCAATAKCADRYYYYQAKPLPLAIKNWQILRDNEILDSREMKDFVKMAMECQRTESSDGKRYHFVAYFNYIMDTREWRKLKSPLYREITVALPRGVVRENRTSKGTYLTFNVEDLQNHRTRTQYSDEYTIEGKTAQIQVFAVRRGIDNMVTPQLIYRLSETLQKYGYRYTEFK
ncbi:hypothetical protein [Pseudomonas agarici]|uniref:hypothetical protein n=1 Tax=Pseudomonas agarici TaxID=46677 RepID=UPI0015A0E4D0|nr:hypothetical protein [Pseudomonas agarici]NWB90228.1 hypothetical protein [Pseudomonas agarici]